MSKDAELWVLGVPAVGGFALAIIIACSPAQQAAEKRDGAVIAADVATCVAREVVKQGATPEGVASACVLATVPDDLRALIDVIHAGAKDAGGQ